MPYFDYAATAPPEHDILTECFDSACTLFANPSSKHRAGGAAKQALEDARTRLANVMRIERETLFFTSGGTESNHIILQSCLHSILQKGTYRLTGTSSENAPEIAISAIEHPSITEAALSLSHLGFKIKTIKCNKDGIITPAAVLDALTAATALVCVMLVNNETGAIQPVYEIAAALNTAAKKSGKKKPHFHVDCVQAAGKIPIALNGSGIDSAAFSAHKLGGARGSGLLYVARPAALDVLAKGGAQESGVRSGTENLFGALALAQVFERYYAVTENQQAIAHNKMQRLIGGIMRIDGAKIIPEARIKTAPVTAATENVMRNDYLQCYSPYIVQAAFKDLPGEVLQRMLSDKDFFISTGSACSSRKQNRPVLDAMGVSKNDAFNAVRFSLWTKTTLDEIDELVATLEQLIAHPCARSFA